MRKLFIILPLALLALVMLPVLAYTHSPAESHATIIILPTPSATPTLPACLTEDGAGQARCYWDAQGQGNGEGTSMVSGDCALAPEASDLTSLCLNLHARDSKTITNEDGSLNTIPNGADLVQECNDESRNAPGIELENCYREWLNS
jgi:hypothetical protein